MKTVLMLYARVLGQPLLLLKLGGLMMVILVVYQIALTLMVGSLIDPGNQVASLQALEQNQLRFILGVVVFTVIYVWLTTMFAIRWHRYVLLGQANYRFFDVTFGKPGWLFVWNSLLIGLLVLVAILPLWLFFSFLIAPMILSSSSSLENVATILFVASIIIFLPGIYVLGRCSLVYPAISLGVIMRIGDSWHASRGHGLRILALLVAMSIPALVGSEIAIRVIPFGSLPIWLTTAVSTFVQTLFVLITTALWASTFSHIYKALGLPVNPPNRPLA